MHDISSDDSLDRRQFRRLHRFHLLVTRGFQPSEPARLKGSRYVVVENAPAFRWSTDDERLSVAPSRPSPGRGINGNRLAAGCVNLSPARLTPWRSWRSVIRRTTTESNVRRKVNWWIRNTKRATGSCHTAIGDPRSRRITTRNERHEKAATKTNAELAIHRTGAAGCGSPGR